MNSEHKKINHPTAAGFCFCAALGLALLAVGMLPGYAQTTQQNCTHTLELKNAALLQARQRLSVCRSAKVEELENFNAKRSRYRRLMSWADQIHTNRSLQPYINALAERDVLLTSKAERFESCVPSTSAMRDNSAEPLSSPENQSCNSTLRGAQKALSTANRDLKSCQGCGLANIGESINKSALEILIAQQKDARMLRKALYRQLSNTPVEISPKARQWQTTRDVFFAYITDTARQVPNTQPLIVMLSQLESKLAAMQTPSSNTDSIVAVYSRLADVLRSATDHRSQAAEGLWQLYINAVDKPHAVKARYSGFVSADDLAQRVVTLPEQQRQKLVTVINTALARYKSINPS